MERLGRYEIIQELGRGAMGVVYKARDPNIDRLVAIKMISPEAGLDSRNAQELADRFQREARAAGRLSHPNIVTIYDSSTDAGRSFLAMEYVEGKNLQTLLDAKREFSLNDILSIASQVARALDYAHQQGIVHRDIKPANIMVTESGHVKVADFGIARITESNITRSGMTVGTPSYMSPEQVTGQKVDGRSDQFSLGATIYELLGGEKAFPGDTISTVVYRIMNEHPIPLRQANPTLPEGVDAVIRRALAKNPTDRYPKCADLGRDLLAVTSGAISSRAAAPALDATSADQSEAALLAAAGRARPLEPTVAATMESVPARAPSRGRLAFALIGGVAVVAIGLGLLFSLRPAAPPRSAAPPASTPPPVAASQPPAPPPPPPPAEPAPPSPQLQELLTAKDVRADGRPIGANTQFSATDPKVVLVAIGTDLTTQRPIRVKWFDPDGKEFPSSGVPKLTLDKKGGWRAWAVLTLAGVAKPGRWKVEFGLADAIESALSFTVAPAAEVAKPSPSPPPTPIPSASPSPPTSASLPQPAGPLPGAVQRRGKDAAEMAYIPSGTFTMGDNHGDGDPTERPASRVSLGGFWIDRFPVTVDQYARFVQGAPHKPQGNWEKQKGYGGNHPAVYVTWNDAVAYCRWADKRLPTEAEWEYSARGPESRKFPWGDSWEPNRARFRGNRGTGTTAAVGSYPAGASPFGILDMAGNVWQWTASLEKPYPYVATDGREEPRASGSRVSRGGSWLGDSEILRAATRDFLSPASNNDKLGFRCAQNP